MRARLVLPLVTVSIALLTGCGGSSTPVAAPVEEAVIPASATRPAPASPDPMAPLDLRGKILTPEQVMYSLTCVDFANASASLNDLSKMAAESKHPGLARAVDMLLATPTAGRIEMARMCANVD